MLLILDIVFLGRISPLIVGGKNNLAIFNLSKPNNGITKKKPNQTIFYYIPYNERIN